MNAPQQPVLIKPTIGRRLWYWPSAYDRGQGDVCPPSVIQQGDLAQPCDAGVVYVHSDRCINITVADHNGVMHSRTSVQLWQDNDPAVPDGAAYAQWMPYQAGQARKGA